MISTKAALDRLFALIQPLNIETIPLQQAGGRVLAKEVRATRDQPPFAASAMDGYALAVDTVQPGDCFTVIGEAAAGHGFSGTVGPGQAVRIFTGAPLPDGARRIVIQEDATRDGASITLGASIDAGTHIRPAGGDFKAGDKMSPQRRLSPADIALLASMNHATVPVFRKPEIALIATGDELVMPGETPRADQIIASNTFGLKVMFERAGAQVRMMPIALDTDAALSRVLKMASDADLVVTIGGASVGDHDIVAKVAANMGLRRAFYKVAMRPGKPLMAGRLGDAILIGLPGNPVSSMVCGEIFILPVIDALQGLPPLARARMTAQLAIDLPANGPREHYERARLHQDGTVEPFARQDSSLLTVLSDADVLLVRPPHDPARQCGDATQIVVLTR